MKDKLMPVRLLCLIAVSLMLCTCAAMLWLSTAAIADVYAEYEVAGTKSAYHTDPNVNSRRTDHFIIRFGPKPRQGFMAEQMYQGHLQFLEHVYDTWLTLGLHPAGGIDPVTKYKAILQPHETWDGEVGGTAVSFEEGPNNIPGMHIPGNCLAYHLPNGCTPHELGHGWQNQHASALAGGLPSTQPAGLSESLANWVMQQQLAGYPADWIVVGMPYGHAATGYNDMSIFNYFMYAPGYGVDFINKLIFDPNLNDWNNYTGDDIIRKAIRCDTSGAVDKAGAIHDGLGLMNAKMLDMDFWNHRVNHAYHYDSDTNWNTYIDGMPQGYQFNRIPMVRQPGVTGTWYRPEWTCIPQALSNNYIPLTITASGSPRTVTCNFQPVADAVRGTSFRACFVAFNQNKEPRYGRLWNAGINSFTLADDETTVYLAIIACPKTLNASCQHCDYTLDNVAMFPYRISLTGANPKGWQWASPTSGTYHTHTLGGGKVANTATVDPTAYVGPNAMVMGTAKVYGNARIEDYAYVDGSAVIGRSGFSDNPVISGHAYVTDTSQVYGHAKIRDYAWVWGASKVYDNAIVMAHTMLNGATVYGGAVMNQAPLRDPGLNYNGVYSGSSQVGGDCSSLGVMACDKGVWCEFPAISVQDNAYQYLGYNFEKKSCVFAMDQYGMNHSYLMNEPQVVRDTVNSVATSVLNLNGTDQYVELRPDAVDFADLSISMWVKWTGSTADQRIFSTGNGSTKCMYLTPKDATTGNIRFVISNGATTQYLDGTAPLTANTWAHVAVTFSGNTAVLYVNGVAVDTDAAITIDPDQLHAAMQEDWNFIGRGNSGNYFQGRIDEFRVYNKALSATEVTDLLSSISTSTAPATDTTAPTPSAAAWLVNPTTAGGNAITMSATEGTDAGGNGVLYYFRCTTDSTHDSGWISENKYTDCNCSAGTTYTYAVKMKDKLGNTGAESEPMSATTPAADTTAPTPNPPTFAVAPVGTSTTSVTMTATKATDNDELVMYKFDRIIPGIGTTVGTSGWTSSRTWNDTGLSTGYAYKLQVKDSHGNITSSVTSSSVIMRDDSAPTLDADFRMQWETYPYTQLDKTVLMFAREQAETAVDYYYECVENPAINSGWTSNKLWVTPALADGTYTFHFRIRDRSPQLNTTGWSATKTAKVLTTNCYNDYALTALAGLPDSTLVRFSGKCTAVDPTYYTVSTTDGLTSIKVVPRTFGYQADATLLNKNVTVKGHLWTYTGSPKCVTGAIVRGAPQAGKIEFENCDYDDDLARPLYDINASGREYLGLYQGGWSVTLPNVSAATTMSLAYRGGAGKLSMYVNGTHDTSMDITLVDTAGGWGSVTKSVSIPPGATLRFQQDPGDSAPELDYLILGLAYSISGKVTNSSGTAIAGATVAISAAPSATLNPTYVAITDSSGNYSKTVPNGTWYVAASAPVQAYITSPDQTVVVNGANRTGINITLQHIVSNFPRSSDLLFSLVTEMIPDSPASPWVWSTYIPTGMSFNAFGTPGLELINGVRWAKNSYTTSDCFRTADYSTSIPINGATIVVACKPIRNTTRQAWYALVNAFFDRLSVGIANDTGRVMARRNGSTDYADSSINIPDGQLTVLSMVVQPTGEYKVFANGTQIMNVTTTSDMTSLVPGVPGGYAKALTVGGNGPDGWSVFNGNIGDVAFYKVALTDAERLQLESTMSAKFGIQQYAITASAGAGGSISPSGALVAAGASQTFAITANVGYGVSHVLVDGVDQGAINSYTFTNVMTEHTISATFTALPTCTITASTGKGGSISPSGAVVVNQSGNQTFTITPSLGYAIDTVLVDGTNDTNAVSTGSYTFTNVTTAHTISATFVPVPISAIAHYKFDESTGTIASDSSGNNKPGTLIGPCAWVSGKYNNGLSLNGSSAYVSLPSGLMSNVGDFTIATWVKLNSNAYWSRIFDFGSDTGSYMFLCLRGNDGIRYAIKPPGQGEYICDYNTPFATGVWKHVAVTQAGSTVTIYIDGVQVAQNINLSPKPSILGNTTQTWIGRSQYTDPYLNGILDDFIIIGTALSSTEVSQLYSASSLFTITASASSGGSITPSGASSVNYGSNKSYTITPAPGCKIVDVKVDGISRGAITSYTFYSISADHTISVTFGKPIGVNNRTLFADAKLAGQLVRVWGKVKSVANLPTYFTISDGHSSPVKVYVNGVTLPTGFGTTKMATVTGTVNPDKTIKALDIKAQ